MDYLKDGIKVLAVLYMIKAVGGQAIGLKRCQERVEEIGRGLRDLRTKEEEEERKKASFDGAKEAIVELSWEIEFLKLECSGEVYEGMRTLMKELRAKTEESKK